MTFPLLALSFLVVAAATVGGASLTRRYFLFGLLGSTLLLALHGRVFLNYLPDDAFIYFRYARNFADGHGPTWNVGGERVEGYTGILWLLPLTVASKLGLDVPETARYLGFALGVGALAMLYPLAAALPAGRRYPLSPVLASLALAAAGPFALWTLAGMEMPLFILLVLIGVWLHLREDAGDAAAVPWSAFAFVLATATRPEGALIVGVTGLFKLSALLDPATRNARFRQLLLWAGFIAVLYGGYLLWRYNYYGDLLPNTFYAKVTVGRDVYDRGVRYLVSSGRDYGVLLLMAGLVAYLAGTRPAKAPLYLATLVAAWMVWVVLSGGDTLLFGRFIAPILPLLYLAAALGAALLLEATVEARNRLVARPAFALLFAAVLLATLYPSLDPFLDFDHRILRDNILIGRWMAEHLPPDTTIAVTWAGAIPYYSRLPTLDMLGLNDTHIAHADVPVFREGLAGVTGGFAGHEKYDIDYVLAQRPQVIFLGGGLSLTPLRTAADYTRVAWVFPSDYYLVQDARTFDQYRPVAIKLRNGGWLNLLVDTAATDTPPALLTGPGALDYVAANPLLDGPEADILEPEAR